MDEEERKRRLEAGKEMLATFRKKKVRKKEKKSRKDGEVSQVSSLPSLKAYHESSLEGEISDTLSCDESDVSSDLETDEYRQESTNSKRFLKIEAKLAQLSERNLQLEEMLVGKQAALDQMVEENKQLQCRLQEPAQTINGLADNINGDISQKTEDEGNLRNQVKALEVAMQERNEMIKKLSEQLKSTTENRDSLQVEYTAQAEQLAQQVQTLQANLIQAGDWLRSQRGDQGIPIQALLEAKTELLALQQANKLKENQIYVMQQAIQQRDNDMQQVMLKLEQAEDRVEELTGKNATLVQVNLLLKQQVEVSSNNTLEESQKVAQSVTDEKMKIEKDNTALRKKEKEQAAVVQQLMLDIENLKKGGVQTMQVESKDVLTLSDHQNQIYALRTELDEMYGKQIGLLQEEFHQREKLECSKLKREIEHISEERDRLSSQVSEWQNRYLVLSQHGVSATDLTAELVALKRENDKYQEQLGTLNQQMTRLQTDRDSLEINLQSSAKQFLIEKETLNQNLQKSFSDNQNLLTEMCALKKRVEDLTSISEKQSPCVMETSAHPGIITDNLPSDDRYIDGQLNVDTLKQSHAEKVQHVNAEHQRELSSIYKEIDVIKAEHGAKIRHMVESHSRILQEAEIEHATEIESMRAEHIKAEKSLKMLEAERCHNELEQINTTQELETIVEQLKDEKTKLQSDFSRDLVSFKRDFACILEEMAGKICVEETAQEITNIAVTEQQSSVFYLDRLRAILEKILQSRNASVEKADLLTIEKRSIEEQLRKLQDQEDHLQSTLKSSEEEIDRLSYSLENVVTVKRDAESKLEQIRNDYLNVVERNEVLLAKIEVIVGEKQELEKENEKNATESVLNLRKTTDQFTQQVDALKAEKWELEVKLKQIETDFDIQVSAREEVATHLREELDEVNLELEMMNKNTGSEVTHVHFTETAGSDMNSTDYIESIDKLNSKVEGLEQENEHIQNQFTIALTQKESLRAEYEATLCTIKENYAHLELEAEHHLQSEERPLELSVADVLDSVQKVEQQGHAETEEQKHKQSVGEDLESEFGIKETLIPTLQQITMEQLQTSMSENNELITKQVDQIEEFREQLTEKERVIVEQSERIHQMQERIKEIDPMHGNDMEHLQTRSNLMADNAMQIERILHLEEEISAQKTLCTEQSKQLDQMLKQVEEKDELSAPETEPLQNLEAQLTEKSELIRQQEESLHRLTERVDGLLAEQSNHIQKLEVDVSENDIELTTLRTQQQQLTEQLTEKVALTERQEEQLGKFEEQIAERDILTAKHTENCQELQKLLSEKEAVISDHMHQVKQLRETLTEKESLSAIHCQQMEELQEQLLETRGQTTRQTEQLHNLDKEIAEKIRLLTEQQEQVRSLGEQVSDKNHLIEKQKEELKRYEDICADKEILHANLSDQLQQLQKQAEIHEELIRYQAEKPNSSKEVASVGEGVEENEYSQVDSDMKLSASNDNTENSEEIIRRLESEIQTQQSTFCGTQQKLEDQVRESVADRDRLISQCNFLEDRVLELTKQCEVAEEKLLEMTHQSENLRLRNETLEQQVKDITDAQDDLQRNVIGLTQNRTDLMNKIEEIEHQKDALKLELLEECATVKHDSAQSIEKLEVELNALKDNNSARIVELEETNIQKTEVLNKLQSDFTVSQDEKNSYQAEVDVLYAKLTSVEVENVKLEEEKKILKELHKEQVNAMKKEFDDYLTDVLAERDKAKVELSTLLQSHEVEREKLKTIIADWQSQSDVLTREKDNILTEFEKYRQSSEHEVLRLRKEVQNLSNKEALILDTHEEDVLVLKEQFERRIESLRTETKRLETEKENSQGQHDEIVHKLRSEYETRLEEMRIRLEDVLSEKGAQKKDYQKQLKDLQDELDHYTAKYQADVEILQAEKESQLSNSQSLIKALRDDNERIVCDLKSEIESLRAEVDRANCEHDKSFSGLCDKKEDVERQLETLQGEAENLCAEHVKEVQTLKEEIIKVCQERDTMASEYQEEIQVLSHQLQIAKENQEDLKEGYENEMKELRTQMENMKTDATQRAEDMLALGKELESLEKEREGLKTTIDKLENNVHALEGTLSSVQQKKSVLSKSHEEEISVLKSEIESLTEASESRSAEKRDFEKVNSQLCEKVKECQELQEELNTVREDMSKLKNEVSKNDFEDKIRLMKEQHESELKILEFRLSERNQLDEQRLRITLKQELEEESSKRYEELNRSFEQKSEAVRKASERRFVEEMRNVRDELNVQHTEEIHTLRRGYEESSLHQMSTQPQAREKQLEEVIHNLEKDNKELAETRDELLQQIDASYQKQDNLQEDISDLENETSFLASENARLSTQVKNCEQLNSGTNQDAEEWRIKYDRLMKENKKLSEESEQIVSENAMAESFRLRIRELEEENIALQARLEDRSSEVEELCQEERLAMHSRDSLDLKDNKMVPSPVESAESINDFKEFKEERSVCVKEDILAGPKIDTEFHMNWKIKYDSLLQEFNTFRTQSVAQDGTQDVESRVCLHGDLEEQYHNLVKHCEELEERNNVLKSQGHYVPELSNHQSKETYTSEECVKSPVSTKIAAVQTDVDLVNSESPLDDHPVSKMSVESADVGQVISVSVQRPQVPPSWHDSKMVPAADYHKIVVKAEQDKLWYDAKILDIEQEFRVVTDEKNALKERLKASELSSREVTELRGRLSYFQTEHQALEEENQTLQVNAGIEKQRLLQTITELETKCSSIQAENQQLRLPFDRQTVSSSSRKLSMGMSDVELESTELFEDKLDIGHTVVSCGKSDNVFLAGPELGGTFVPEDDVEQDVGNLSNENITYPLKSNITLSAPLSGPVKCTDTFVESSVENPVNESCPKSTVYNMSVDEKDSVIDNNFVDVEKENVSLKITHSNTNQKTLSQICEKVDGSSNSILTSDGLEQTTVSSNPCRKSDQSVTIQNRKIDLTSSSEVILVIREYQLQNENLREENKCLAQNVSDLKLQLLNLGVSTRLVSRISDSCFEDEDTPDGFKDGSETIEDSVSEYSFDSSPGILTPGQSFPSVASEADSLGASNFSEPEVENLSRNGLNTTVVLESASLEWDESRVGYDGRDTRNIKDDKEMEAVTKKKTKSETNVKNKAVRVTTRSVELHQTKTKKLTSVKTTTATTHSEGRIRSSSSSTKKANMSGRTTRTSAKHTTKANDPGKESTVQKREVLKRTNEKLMKVEEKSASRGVSTKKEFTPLTAIGRSKTAKSPLPEKSKAVSVTTSKRITHESRVQEIARLQQEKRTVETKLQKTLKENKELHQIIRDTPSRSVPFIQDNDAFSSSAQTFGQLKIQYEILMAEKKNVCLQFEAEREKLTNEIRRLLKRSQELENQLACQENTDGGSTIHVTVAADGTATSQNMPQAERPDETQLPQQPVEKDEGPNRSDGSLPKQLAEAQDRIEELLEENQNLKWHQDTLIKEKHTLNCKIERLCLVSKVAEIPGVGEATQGRRACLAGEDIQVATQVSQNDSGDGQDEIASWISLTAGMTYTELQLQYAVLMQEKLELCATIEQEKARCKENGEMVKQFESRLEALQFEHEALKRLHGMCGEHHIQMTAEESKTFTEGNSNSTEDDRYQIRRLELKILQQQEEHSKLIAKYESQEQLETNYKAQISELQSKLETLQRDYDDLEDALDITEQERR